MTFAIRFFSSRSVWRHRATSASASRASSVLGSFRAVRGDVRDMAEAAPLGVGVRLASSPGVSWPRCEGRWCLLLSFDQLTRASSLSVERRPIMSLCMSFSLFERFLECAPTSSSRDHVSSSLSVTLPVSVFFPKNHHPLRQVSLLETCWEHVPPSPWSRAGDLPLSSSLSKSLSP